jgi:hypothetical protein
VNVHVGGGGGGFNRAYGSNSRFQQGIKEPLWYRELERCIDREVAKPKRGGGAASLIHCCLLPDLCGWCSSSGCVV